ncbi:MULTISPECIES: hypothetical protein [unclassified Methylobacterium]|uniref:hypothetical protein n=1 Tax=unclassified Methylobacterium TaxID=2615210 RepID=UPI0006FCB401|nr:MULTISPECIES: hypothetical protein [unclassified Methylobacterium]KQP82829.1 hypothetical protein ASF57_11860 [Methylobacterium sp. Leaf117]MCK2054832.1 hypothetical protein [Methylobacterium sp. 37f]
MHENSAGPAAFWASVAHDVTSRVEPVLAREGQIREGKAREGKAREGKARGGQVREGQVREGQVREGVIEYLRDLEAVALREGSSREALQVIASGRRLLGDRSEVPADKIARAVRSALV